MSATSQEMQKKQGQELGQELGQKQEHGKSFIDKIKEKTAEVFENIAEKTGLVSQRVTGENESEQKQEVKEEQKSQIDKEPKATNQEVQTLKEDAIKLGLPEELTESKLQSAAQEGNIQAEFILKCYQGFKTGNIEFEKVVLGEAKEALKEQKDLNLQTACDAIMTNKEKNISKIRLSVYENMLDKPTEDLINLGSTDEAKNLAEREINKLREAAGPAQQQAANREAAQTQQKVQAEQQASIEANQKEREAAEARNREETAKKEAEKAKNREEINRKEAAQTQQKVQAERQASIEANQKEREAAEARNRETAARETIAQTQQQSIHEQQEAEAIAIFKKSLGL
jgi:hypothetical protein